MIKKLDHKHGIMLVELMMALLIVTVSVMALYYMFIQGNAMILEQDHKRIAFERIKERLVEEQVNYYNNQFRTGEYTGVDFLVEPDEENESLGIRASFVVTRVLNEDNLPFVTVTYNWFEFNGVNVEVTARRNFKRLGS